MNIKDFCIFTVNTLIYERRRKKNELIQLILNLNEEALLKLESIKENHVNEEVITYSSEGNPMSKDVYVEHINTVRQNIKNGSRTYSTQDVKTYVLNKKI